MHSFSYLNNYLHKPYIYFRKIRQIIDTFGSNLHIELQQRGIEFSQLFRKYDHLRPALLERMPPMETARPQANGIIGMVNGEPEPEEDKSSVLEASTPPSDSVSLYRTVYKNYNLNEITCTAKYVKLFIFNQQSLIFFIFF